MTKITILGAGITSLATATLLPRHHTITIIARDLPGDPAPPRPSSSWASPLACAGWVALGGTPLEQKMQLDALHFLRRLAVEHPESGVVASELVDLFDDADETFWGLGRVPGIEALEAGKEGMKLRYPSAVASPDVLLPWLRARLEAQGVKFVRVDTVTDLKEVEKFGGDVVINACGAGAATLGGVGDDKVVVDRTYTVLVKSTFEGSLVRRGAGGRYTYVFGRGDGTAVVGGVSEGVGGEVRGLEEVRRELMRRANEELPEYFPSGDHKDYDIVRDLVGVRPMRIGGVRVEKEVVGGMKVVHAYGTTIGGYIFSFGLAREVARLVDEFVFEGSDSGSK
ncbi:D-amino-acid oxidase [Podospora conica]|nr:D-amino-acid oxidase [Schizothecium conicum]